MVCLGTGLHAGIPGKFHDFAHIGDGQGIIRTTFIVMNQNSTAVNVKLSLFGDDGSPLALSIDSQTASVFNFQVPAEGMSKLTTDSKGAAVVTGWARITADGDVGAQVLFEIFSGGNLVTRAAVEPSGGLAKADLVVDQEGGAAIGVAIANQTSGSISVRLTLRDDTGTEIESTVLDLDPREHVAKFVNQLFSQTVKKGSIHLNASGQFTVTSLQQTGLILGTFPPVEVL
jgi:hypothetical protein